MSQVEEESPWPTDQVPGEAAPFGVKLLTCFLLLDAVDRTRELVFGGPEVPGGPVIVIFILWVAIDLLLAFLITLRTSAGRYWTQAILVIHVFYIANELAWRAPHLWLMLGFGARARILATVFVDGFFTAYLSSDKVKAYLQDGP